MSGKFFEAVKELFSHSRAFELFADNSKRRLIQGFAALPENLRTEAELVYFDLFPDTTRFPERWEKVFALFFTEAELSKRRNILDSMWKMISGDQGLSFLEAMLQRIDDQIHVVENIPISNPRHSGIAVLAVCGYHTMRCGNRKAVCGYREGYQAFVPTIIMNDATTEYNIPDDSAWWENCFFVCKSVIRNPRHRILYVEPLPLNVVWKNYVEYIILKVKPAQTTAIGFIDWQNEGGMP
jgi:hypothetical protein